MVEHSHLPSPEFEKPLTERDVTEIAKEVEKRYEAGTIGTLDTAPNPKHPKQPEVDEEQEIRTLQEHGTVISADESKDIVEAATEKLLDVPAPQQQEAKRREPTPEEIIRALGIEEKIIKNNPHLAMKLRLDEKPWVLGAENTKLLPNEADTYEQRQKAFTLNKLLINEAERVQKNDEQLTAENALEFIDQFNRQETPLQKKYYARHPTVAPPKFDVTLEQLFATSERNLLQAYMFQQSAGMNPHHGEYAQGVAMVHTLLEGMTSPKQTMDAASHDLPHATPK